MLHRHKGRAIEMRSFGAPDKSCMFGCESFRRDQCEVHFHWEPGQLLNRRTAWSKNFAGIALSCRHYVETTQVSTALSCWRRDIWPSMFPSEVWHCAHRNTVTLYGLSYTIPYCVIL